jgi:tetratricopeptide (TPR) repeat protein
LSYKKIVLLLSLLLLSQVAAQYSYYGDYYVDEALLASSSDYYEGVALLKAGEFLEAIDCFNLAMENDSLLATVYPWYALGRCYFELGEYDKALSKLGVAVALDQYHEASQFYRAMSLTRLERYDEAAEDYDRAVVILGDDTAYANRAELYMTLEQLDMAIPDLDKALEYNPDSIKALTLRMRVNLDSGQFYAALEDGTRVRELNPQDNANLYCLILAYLVTEQGDQAGECIETLIAQAPAAAQGYYLGAYLLWRVGDEQAQQWADAATERDPDGAVYAEVKSHLTAIGLDDF